MVGWHLGYVFSPNGGPPQWVRLSELLGITGTQLTRDEMKTNLIGMILNNAGRRCFEGALLDDDGKPMPAADSLHTLIMEYAKVVNGGASDVVTTSREVLRPNAEVTG